MRIAIYSPYLDTFGGGEKYMMTIAEVFTTAHLVDVILDKHLASIDGDYLKRELSKRFDLKIDRVNFINGPVGKGSNFLRRLAFFKSYDLLFYLTDGSIFYPTAKKNILHIQSPLLGEPSKSLTGKIKLKGWNLIIYNSLFTKKNSERNWPINSQVIYPPVDIEKIKPGNKKKYILSVGRFFGYLKDKKQELLINVFKGLYEQRKINGWSLHLVGSASEGDKPYLDKLKKLSAGLPIKFYPNLKFKDLINLYGESSIYWHASGFREDDPTKMEHFGISTVEAMAGGCIPVVIGKGGQMEIVENKKSGYLWDNLEELKNFTLELINSEDLRIKLSGNAIKRSKTFSKQRFEESIIRLK